MPVSNYGPQINLISGLTGISSGGTGVWLPPANLRYHRAGPRSYGIALAGGTGLASTLLTGAGSGATFTYTPNSAGTIAATGAITVASDGTGYTVGSTLTVADPNYPAASGYVSPIVVTVATVSSGAISTITYTVTAQPTQPALFYGTNPIQIKVNSVLMRNLSAADTLGIIAANPTPANFSLQPGILPILFTEPWRNVLRKPDLTSWDMYGQPNFEMDFPISPGVTSPSINGVYEFDNQRNTYKNSKGVTTAFLKPVKYLTYNTGVIGAGFYDWTALPINYPIIRIWLVGSSPGNITRVTLIQDGNIVLDALTQDVQDEYGRYGFDITGLTNTSNALSTTWDYAYISDKDQRIGKELKVSQSLILRIYSNVSQNVRAVLEVDPGNYA